MSRAARPILAVASAGGHWQQLLRIADAFEGGPVYFVSTASGFALQAPADRPLFLVRDANHREPLACLQLLLQMLWIVLRLRPRAVVSTGAAPGCLALVLGRLCGAKTVWVDSIANAERLSLSGRLVRPFAGLWLTQWPHLAGRGGPQYTGRVL
jgi:UDP-N-acetylglucosamine:LPS N-acetylglucosamine transferase